MYNELVRCDITDLYNSCDNNRFNEIETLESKINYADLNANEDEFYTLFKIKYLHDVWRRESDVNHSGKTIEHVIKFIENNDFDMLAENLNSQGIYNPVKHAKKICNLNNVIDTYFRNDWLFINRISDGLTIDIVNDVHATIMNGLIDTPGVFRTSHAKPAGFSLVYIPPHKINDRLTSLLNIINEELSRCGTNRKKALVIAAEFYTEFLHIHPFQNGNGRTARILTNYLLKNFFIAPFTLITLQPNEFMKILNECQSSTSIKPRKILNEFINGLIHHYDDLSYVTC